MIVGEPAAGEEVEIGPLISKAHFDRVTGYLERAEAEGYSRTKHVMHNVAR